MKKLNKFAFMGAIALGAVGFTACSSDDDITSGQNPTFDGESVKTQFAINIPNAGSSTRLTDDIVQSDGTTTQFRGMSNIRLVPFKNLTGNPITLSSSQSLSGVTPITLPAIGATGDLQTPDAKNYNYKVYYDVPVDLDVNYFLFYGEAATTAGSGYEDNGSTVPSFDENGSPTASTSTLADITFDLRDRLNGASVTNDQKILAKMLTDIASATGTNSATWATQTGNDLASYYTAFKSLKAGSANSIKAAIADLYASMKSDGVADYEGLKAAICAKIETYFTPGNPSKTSAYVDYPDFAYKTTEVTVPDIQGNVALPATFPANYNLPDGSMKLKFEGNAFAYDDGTTIGSTGGAFQTIAYDNYTYPASLYYTVATPIKVANTTQTNGGVYNNATTYNDWQSLVDGLYTGADNNKVTSETQSIALVNPINYAVASLNLYAHFADQAINDNGELDGVDEGTKPVNIPDAGFPLTGVLIGNQKTVGFDFKPLADDAKTWTIYDSSHGEGGDAAAVKKGSGNPATPTAYTLALETEGATSDPYETVNFAIELVNNSGDDFKGADGIVPAGGKFYLVGSLTSDADHNKVFEQDHKTIAYVTINSLKSAYNTIPDLRSPKLEIGLAVDLQWREGLVDDVVIE